MQIGIQSAQTGRLADPAAIRAVADAAEQLGYASLWVVDRLPEHPGDAPSPVLDPLVVAATLAATTARPRLGTSVLVGPWYPPVLLARALDALVRVSHHRLDVGLGTGRSDPPGGSPDGRRGTSLDVLLDVLDDHAWPDARPPRRLLAGSGAAALDRAARRADGWIATGLPLEALALLWTQVRDLAGRHGRDADRLRFVVRAEVALAPAGDGDDRPLFTGSVDQVADDVARVGALGADDVILGIAGDPGLDEALDTWARVVDALDGLVATPTGPAGAGAPRE